MNKITSKRLSQLPDTPSLVVLNNGGGTQSGTMIEMIADGLLPKPDAVIQADTGDEPAYIYRQWERDKALMATAGVPYLVVRNGNLHDDLYGGKRFAAMPLFTRRMESREMLGITAGFFQDGKLKRHCTSEYKVTPIDREIRRLLLEMGLAKARKNGQIVVNQDVFVESWIGYTMDEFARIKDSRCKWQYFRYPLIEMRMTKQDCIEWLAANGKPSRLGSFCRKCPLIGNRQMRELRDNDPTGWENRIQFDNDLRNPDSGLRIAATAMGDLYIHPDFVPLESVSIDETESLPLFMCSNTGCMT